ncbi:hypothetical protein PHYBLDRAFT_63532 [Phycomyces blakesleeanus NRRL 1555(-)]|uniref:Transposase domain-containing protein n=1 Tax=Phycomyces blakesleeanus (strain ATCC 8743b / DSM 1359 / FGSC 10004 / NBRC 33097 / NRRL 1555) TaxID=763407 RepID=A0A162NDN6_PHYB8|nr:hypothetical protein PHYBLDRAFT_63532 [Phycomyces blakesleeanus NRRL 1555(-)]OAD68554.1 hypothetical protein PHYBLDRAFT_63532 [Phycomyces blakesleeanus NRRL 1555(-)]|eukprot:XP_018286594.1 hypothetical protein PHYBLDRAFT_63532 [Phycomyces blakesleeanus NRRL 1555(-)]
MLTLNIDWFQPFNGVIYSCGAIYLAINNLPRSEQFKENVILVGLMPGPKEVSTSDINNYLKPLVDELMELYKDIKIKTHQSLLMVACDILAARKVCGFTSHTSTNACHKCKRQFLRLAGTSSIDYSGFDFSKWLLRTKNDNRKDAEIWRNATKPTERQCLEVAHGVRWSELHRLQYFDIVHCTIINPMHNPFLGTAKRMLERWVADGLIDDKKLVAMQKTVEKSPVVLRDVLPLPEFKNWIEFVNACRYFTKPSVSEEDIEKGHKCLEEFCKGCETLYNLDLLSPNMHLYLHLCQTMIDFGPVYDYWLFSFERYNSVLKNIQTNRRNRFELTFMRQFIEESWKRDFNLSMTICGNEPLPPSALPLKTRSLSFMPKHEYDCLVGYYQAAYKNPQISGCKDVIDDPPFVNDWIEMVKSVDLIGQSYKGCIGTNDHGSYIQAYFTERTGLEHAYIGDIQYLFVHNFRPTVSSLTYRNPHSSQHVFAFVKWFKSTSDKTRELEGVELLQDEFYKQDFQSILPVHRILLTVAIVDYKTTKNVNKKLAIPLPKKIYY